MHYNSGAVKKLLKSGRLQQEHIDRAVRNILRVLIRQVPQIRPRSRDCIGSPEHRALALELAEKGVVLLENNGVLPLARDTRLMVTGPYANEINVGDQGSSRKKEGEYFASASERLKKKPKNCGGDRASLRLEPEEIALIRSLKEQGKKVIAVIYSGCAVIVEEWKQYADAIVMNYYSGCFMWVPGWHGPAGQAAEGLPQSCAERRRSNGTLD